MILRDQKLDQEFQVGSNGLYHARSYDQAYSATEIDLFSWDGQWGVEVLDALGYGVDDAGNIGSIDDWVDSDKSRTYGYDGLNRLTWDSGVSSTAPTYTYDGNGNRLERLATVSGFADQAFTYETASNRIDTFAVNSGTAHSVSYDGMGNVTDNTLGHEFTADEGGRLSRIYETASTTAVAMHYNGLGELARARKTTANPCNQSELLLALEYFSFAPDGRALELVSENNSRVESDWVWLDGMPVAQFTDSYDAGGTYQGTTVTYLHADHLGTPRLGTDQNRSITWRYESDAFGNGTPSGSAIVRLRLPGQIALGLGGVNYNYFRDYDPNVGRYLESDPIGIEGGLNTYGYVGQNPLRWMDPLGLDVLVCRRKADLPFPLSLFDHAWIKTSTYEAGLGGECGGIPGQDCSDKPYSATKTKDHSGQADKEGSSCEVMRNVDEQCVDELIKPDQPNGPWHPFNQCQSFAYGVINRCRTGPQMSPIPDPRPLSPTSSLRP